MSSEWLVVAGGIATVVMFVASVVAVPWMLVRMPADYFKHPRPHLLERLKTADFKKRLALIAKNLLGVILAVAGIAMLVLPGQGILTIIAALILMDLPRKHEWQQRLVHRPQVAKAINWLRQKRGRSPLEL